jgi:AcrR family transcriptional regulator
MARQPDPALEGRILNAARQLWKKGVGEALTMRAVARAAGTNTPAVYRRFRRREDILRALWQRTRQEILQQLEVGSSAEESCERYLDFALSHPHEYELYYLHEYELFSASAPAREIGPNQMVRRKRPAEELMKGKLATQLGGSPDDYTRLSLAVWALLHGTVMLLITKTIPPSYAMEMRSVCRASVETLLLGESRLRVRDSG